MPSTKRGLLRACLRCRDLSMPGTSWCNTHAFLVDGKFDLDAIDDAADAAGISVACLVREAIAKTVEGLKR